MQLHFDATSATDVEVDSEGVWTVLGGKVSFSTFVPIVVS